MTYYEYLKKHNPRLAVSQDNIGSTPLCVGLYFKEATKCYHSHVAEQEDFGINPDLCTRHWNTEMVGTPTEPYNVRMAEEVGLNNIPPTQEKTAAQGCWWCRGKEDSDK